MTPERKVLVQQISEHGTGPAEHHPVERSVQIAAGPVEGTIEQSFVFSMGAQVIGLLFISMGGLATETPVRHVR